MSWSDFFWGLVIVIALTVWMRGVSNHNHRWHFYEYLFSGCLLTVLLVAARQFF